MSFEPIQSKKELFMNYLNTSSAEESSLLEMMSQVLVDLHQEESPPESPLAYFKSFLGCPSDLSPGGLQRQIDLLGVDNEGLKGRVASLEQEIEALKPKEEEKGEEKKEEEE